nr:alpha/beta hydrolase [Parvularcula dongshanensis]
MIAGGPGESGASFYPFLATVRAALPGYDVIIPDHRGTGFSARLCPKEESVSSAGGTALSGPEWGSCFQALNVDAARTRAFTISNAARDLALLIERFGADKDRLVYGVSYGTQLVLRMLTIAGPGGIDGVVLDSLIPVEDTQRWDLSRRSAVVDGVGRQVLRDCADLRGCGVQGGRLEERMAALVDDPATADMVGTPPRYAFGALLDDPETRAMIPQILDRIEAGDGSAMAEAQARREAVAALFEPYPQAPSSIPLVSLISRSENTARPALTKEQIAAEEEDYLFASPLPSQLISGGIPTYERDEYFAARPERVPPSLVLHGDRDPKTPYEGAVEHVASLEPAGPVQLVTAHGASHFVLMTMPSCFAEAVRTFVDDGVASDSACSAPR